MILLCVFCFFIMLSICVLASQVNRFMRKQDERLQDIACSICELSYQIESLAYKYSDTERNIELLEGDTEK